MKLRCHFSLHAQYLVKFGMTRSAKCWNKTASPSVKHDLGERAGCGLTGSWTDHSRIMLRIMLESAAQCRGCFLSYLGASLFVAGAIFGEVGAMLDCTVAWSAIFGEVAVSLFVAS